MCVYATALHCFTPLVAVLPAAFWAEEGCSAAVVVHAAVSPLPAAAADLLVVLLLLPALTAICAVQPKYSCIDISPDEEGCQPW